MPLILSIESSTRNCSIAIRQDDLLLAVREESSEQYIHSEKLHTFIQECVAEANISLGDLDAIAVGKGPGSYTGLRIGISAAKGLCYALSIPLIAIDGLQLMARDLLNQGPINQGELIIPMIDARRMEVYCAVYDDTGNCLSEVRAHIIDENSFADLNVDKIHLIGDGAFKARDILPKGKFIFSNILYPSARTLAILAMEKFSGKEFEDVAYFEPFYLKDFIAGKPRKQL